MTLVNFVFLRHGESCQQVIYKHITDKIKKHELFETYTDPPISDSGVIDSIEIGEKYSKLFSNGKFGKTIDSFDIIGCSPMLRAIETAYFMSLQYKPNNIYVYPFLRECRKCNETDTAEILNKLWPMRSINDQKNYLEKEGIHNINFKYVDNNNDREAYGNISIFLDWFSKNIILPDKPEINILIITHSHVIATSDYSELVDNNGGFILSTTIIDNNIKYNKNNIRGIWPNHIYKKFKCPTNRCKDVCL